MTTITGERYTLIQGDCLEELRTMAAGSVHCVITSPPYYGLRDYGHDGQIGLEETPEQYVAKLVAVFRELWRVLRDDGVCWLNLGDSYANNTAAGNKVFGNPEFNANRPSRAATKTAAKIIPAGLKPKDLIGIPWRVAFALQADGWYLRQDIIWHKPNPMPESVTDRCTKAHEYVFLLTKAARYWYDNDVVRERTGNEADPKSYRSTQRRRDDLEGYGMGNNGHSAGLYGQRMTHPQGRNRRSVWTVATQPYSGSHFATFPPKLIEPMVLAGCPAQCCPTCGKGWGRVVEKIVKAKAKPSGRAWIASNFRADGDVAARGLKHDTETHTLGFRPACDCGNAESVAGVVLDPFNGSGTTGEVALLNGRRYVGIELSADYMELSRERVGAAEEAARNASAQLSLFDVGGGDLTTTARERASAQLSLLDWQA